MSEPIETLEGWYALHDIRRIDWAQWAKRSLADRQKTLAAVSGILGEWDQPNQDHTGSFGLYQLIGHKGDLLFLNFRETTDQLLDLEWQFHQLGIDDVFKRSYSYYSVVELSKYLAQGDANPDTNAFLRRRLYPSLPKTRYMCFYPMNKRRQGNDNWYTQTRDQRRDLMKDHGIIGHKYHNTVTQIITGSQGLDDWEWGVTLYAEDPLLFKKLIYEMRFDEASARFADFGQFFVGRHREISDLGLLLTLP